MLLNLLYFTAIILLSPWLIARSIRTGRYRHELRAKLFGSRPVEVLGDGKIVWCHGVSVGEVHLLRPIVADLQRRHPTLRIVISATTDTGLSEARKHFPNLPIIPYPFDFTWAVSRTIHTVNPGLIVLAESELWPNFLKCAARRSIPVVVVNGRMSPRTQRRYARIAGLARRLLFRRITMFGMQTETYANNLVSLGVDPKQIRVTGSVKYDGSRQSRDNPKTLELATLLNISPNDAVWVAGSTHDPEEQIVVAVYGRLRKRYPNLRLIIVPRAPERFDEVATIVHSAGLPIARRSQLQSPAPKDAVILIDTLGELSAVWGLATIGFTGGSLNRKRGGQSMIEPAGLGVPVLFGPHTWNFRDAVLGLRECGGAIEISDEGELEAQMERLLRDLSLRQSIGAAAQRFVISQQGATKRTVDMLDEILSVS